MSRTPWGQRGGTRTWKKFRPRETAAGMRDVEKDMELEAAKWRTLAPRLGFCGGCGAIVDEANGKLHDEQCMPGAPERCRKGQVT